MSIKKYVTLIFFASITCLHGRSQSGKQTHDANISDTSIYLVIQTDAEKILGQSATLSGRSVQKNDTAAKYNSAYTANDSVSAGNRTAHLYYAFEAYNDKASAKKVYDNILSQNKMMPGLKKVDDLGDEALRHTDNENFELVIVRKNNKIIRLKVNKLTGITSSKELLAIAKKIVNYM